MPRPAARRQRAVDESTALLNRYVSRNERPGAVGAL
jgi:hypothetical protein